MKQAGLKKRYDSFCAEAQELLEKAGYAREDQTPKIIGKAFYNACVVLATIHFPEDKEVNGIGPRGLLWGMYDAVEAPHMGAKEPNPVSGARSIALVLQQIIKHRPLLDLERPPAPLGNQKPDTKGSGRVFIVHGHNSAAKQSVARFLEQLGVRPIILHEQAIEGRTIIENFERYSAVDFAVVLLTADDTGYPRTRPEEAKNRARQNVLFEWGYFVGSIGRTRVCALYEEGVEIPSDYQGVLYIPMDKAESWKLQLAREIRAAGLSIKIERLIR